MQLAVINPQKMRNGTNGFTMVELVVVIVLLGILAAYAAPKFAGRGGYDELTAQQDIKQTIRFAQQLAMSRTDHTITFVTVTSTTPHQIDVRQDGATIGGPTSPYPYPKPMTNVSFATPTTLTFDRFGSAGSTTAQINIIGSVQTRAVCVQGTTGYAQDC